MGLLTPAPTGLGEGLPPRLPSVNEGLSEVGEAKKHFDFAGPAGRQATFTQELTEALGGNLFGERLRAQLLVESFRIHVH